MQLSRNLAVSIQGNSRVTAKTRAEAYTCINSIDALEKKLKQDIYLFAISIAEDECGMSCMRDELK